MKKIIIDGVDISNCDAIYDDNKCQYYYDTENWEICGYDKCSDYPNCYYKQLKRKEKEFEVLKEQVEYLQNFNIKQNEAYTFMNNLHWSNEDLEKVKYKQTLQKIKEIAKFACEKSICHHKCSDCSDGKILQIINEVEE